MPATPIYLTLKEQVGQPEAYRIIEEATFETADSIGKKLAALMRIPEMRSLFVKVWNPSTRKMFGESSGFENVFYPKKEGRVPDGRGVLPVLPLFLRSRLLTTHEDLLRCRRPCM